MRVAVVTQYFPISFQPWAGHSAYQTLRHLAQQCDLKVFYPHAVDAAGLRPASRRQRLPVDSNYRPQGVDVEYVPYPVVPVLSRPFNGWMAAKKLFPHVTRYAPDVILNYVVYPDGLAATTIAQKLEVPVVLTAIGSDLNRMSDPICARLTRSTLRRADITITVSRDLLKTALRLGSAPDRSHAILNGCDTTVFRIRDMADARNQIGMSHDVEAVVFVGRFDVRKGLIELIRAAADLRMRRPGLNVYLIGDGPDKPALLKEIQTHQASEWIHLIPPCTSALVALWMSAANLVTLPSYKEGCPNVVIEALAAGRPVVATKVGGIPELMNESSGRLVAPQNVQELELALDQTLSTRWNPDEISRRHNRSWKAVASEVYDCLLQAIQTRAANKLRAP